jgi:hypothetical protein
MFMYYGCDRGGELGESCSRRREGRGEGCSYSEVLRWQPPPVSIKDCVVLALMTSFSLY